jgi:hypothetical protein
MSNAQTAEKVTLREAEPGDLDACAQIVFDAFGSIHDQHRFPRDFPVLEAASGLMQAWIPHPDVWGVVAESDGRVIGSNFLDERGKRAPGIRLVQDGFHMRSLSLYTSLGFDVTASCVLMSGEPGDKPADGIDARPVTEDDIEQCEALCKQVHGFDRTGSLRDAIAGPSQPFAAVRDGRVTAYATAVTFWPMAYGVAETDDDMKALLLGAAAVVEDPIALLVPLESALFRWCLEQGLRGVKPMNVMALGAYQDPRGSWFPSVLY